MRWIVGENDMGNFNVVALYKTFSGEDFVTSSIESIYDACYKIVFVHSRFSWTGEEGNTVSPVVEAWKVKNDKQNKIINLYTDISQQSEQYDFGFTYIKKHFHECDFVMLIDTDEVWDKAELSKALKDVYLNRHEFDAFNINLHTYIKSLLFRINPPEWCKPTVFIKSSVPKILGIRGSMMPKRKLIDVFMHHFTYVRFNEQEVIDKIYRTAATEKVNLVNIEDWIKNKWDKLPYAENFHTVDYAKESWKSVDVIAFEDLPESIKDKAELFSKLLINGNDVGVKQAETVESTPKVTATPKVFNPVKLPKDVKALQLRQCTRVGVNLTWKCNWKCQNCFYRYNSNLHTNAEEPFESIKRQIDNAKARGCDHAVAVGFGEPSLYSEINKFVEYCNSVALTSSIITNGATGVKRFESLYASGINHLHVSVHHIGTELDKIAQVQNAGKLQHELKAFLKNNKLPWRSNTTLQADNYRSLPDIIANIIEYGAFHVVLLGFLPHYEWSDKSKALSVLIPPKNLRPFIEEACRILIEADKLFTIRYQPFCHLSPDLWKYVTNARYVIYDPWEWDYGHCGKPPDIFKLSAEKINSCGIKTEPCSLCAVQLHCGGWNKTYAMLCGGAKLRPITRAEVPYEYLPYLDTYGGIHVLNPANKERGYYVK